MVFFFLFSADPLPFSHRCAGTPLDCKHEWGLPSFMDLHPPRPSAHKREVRRRIKLVRFLLLLLLFHALTTPFLTCTWPPCSPLSRRLFLPFITPPSPSLHCAVTSPSLCRVALILVISRCHVALLATCW